MGAIPLQAELERGTGERRRALPRTTDFQKTGIAEIEISADGLRLQAHRPCILRVLPNGEIGVGEGVRLFFLPDFQINSSPVGLDVREARARLRTYFGGGRDRDFCGALQQVLDVPVSALVVDKV